MTVDARSNRRRLPAEIKIVGTLAIILTAALTPIEHWPVHGVLLGAIFAGLSLARMPLWLLAIRLAIFAPLLAIFALSVPLSQSFQSGGDIAAAVFLRGLTAFGAILWLSASTRFDGVLYALPRLGTPRAIVAMLAFMHRFIFLLWEELDRMRAARAARTGGRAKLRSRWRSSVQLLGMLLIRAFARAERVHGAMQARGWDGTVRSLATAESIAATAMDRSPE